MCRSILVIVLAVAKIVNKVNCFGFRIVGGNIAAIEEFPYQVSIEFLGTHSCGGSLIRPNIVLTAAHCINTEPSAYVVRAGTSTKEKGGQIVKVIKTCNHPKYNEVETFYDYDVSVLKLERPFDLDSSVQLIELQPIDVTVPDGKLGTVTGWGRLTYKGIAPDILHVVKMPKSSVAFCKKQNENLYPITERMTCYGDEDGGKDACQMDSGGPMVVNNRQVGIVSWGEGCGFAGYPGVYARVSNPDIQNHITMCIQEMSS